MRKKLQVFVSSTYTDLRDERQAAVEAILEAGQIPAGMELFAASSESQLAVVKRWIDESDVYMLILGGRYGSIEPKSGKSYTHVEYEYAVETNKPLFAVFASNLALKRKVDTLGLDASESGNPKLNEFRELVLSRMSAPFTEPKDIKLEVHKALAGFESNPNISGWVSGRFLAQQTAELRRQLSELAAENNLLKEAVAQAQSKPGLTLGADFYELLEILQPLEITAPASFPEIGGKKIQVLYIFHAFRSRLATGVTNSATAKASERFIFAVGAELIPFGLVERTNVPANAQWDKLVTTKSGNEFLVKLAIWMNANNKADGAAPDRQ